jgi:hypothetical protein
MKSFPLRSPKYKMIAVRVCVISHYLQLAYPRRDAAARHLRTLGDLIATNSEVRKILSDFSVIGRDILARTASHAAERVRPEQDALSKVDRPAPSDQFEAAGSRDAGPSGTPEGQVHPAFQTADDVQHSEVTEVKAATGYVPVLCHSFHRYNWFNSSTIDTDADGDTKKSGFTSRLQNFKASIELYEQSLYSQSHLQNGLSDLVPQEHKEEARNQLEQSRKVLAEDYFPEDRRDQFIYRIKKVYWLIWCDYSRR